MIKKHFYTFLDGIVFIAALFFVSKTNIIIHPDSSGYIDASLIRSFGYPAFLFFHKYVFGIDYLNFVKYSQFILIFFSAYVFKNTVNQYIIKNKIYIFLLFLLLLLPLFFESKIANSILSEGVSYALYLFFLSALLHLVYSEKASRVMIILSTMLLLILINCRGQFLFLIPFLFIVLIFKHLKSKILVPKLVVLVLLIGLVFSISILVDKTYHKIKHQHFTSTPWTGIQLAALPFFISKESDSTLFKNETEKKYFVYIYKELSHQKLLLHQVPTDLYDYDFYATNFTTICNKTLSEYGELFFYNETKDIQTIKNDAITTKVAWILFKNHFFKWTSFVVKNLYNGFFSISNFLILIFVIVISIFNYLKSKKDLYFTFAFFSLLIVLNLLLVALVEPIISRYIFYNNWVYFVILAFLIENSKQNSLS